MHLKDYLVLNYAFANTLIEEGKIKKAIEVLKEIIELNQDDFLNARHILMSCYAYLENEKDLLELVNKYNEENLPSLLPLLILYYKQENNEKALFYLDKINKKNRYFLKSFKEDLELEKGINLGEFKEGKPSEVIMCNNLLYFLIDQVPSLETFVLENSKNNLKKK